MKCLVTYTIKINTQINYVKYFKVASLFEHISFRNVSNLKIKINHGRSIFTPKVTTWQYPTRISSMLPDTWVNAEAKNGISTLHIEIDPQKPAPGDGQAIRACSQNISSRVRNSFRAFANVADLQFVFLSHYSHDARCARSCLVPTEATTHYLIYQKGVSHNCAGHKRTTPLRRPWPRQKPVFALAPDCVLLQSRTHSD